MNGREGAFEFLFFSGSLTERGLWGLEPGRRRKHARDKASDGS